MAASGLTPANFFLWLKNTSLPPEVGETVKALRTFHKTVTRKCFQGRVRLDKPPAAYSDGVDEEHRSEGRHAGIDAVRRSAMSTVADPLLEAGFPWQASIFGEELPDDLLEVRASRRVAAWTQLGGGDPERVC